MAAVDDGLHDVDVLLCASSMDPPSRREDAAETERTDPQQARPPFNVTGHPALAMMSGLSRNGLPLSVQFVGRYYATADIIDYDSKSRIKEGREFLLRKRVEGRAPLLPDDKSPSPS